MNNNIYLKYLISVKRSQDNVIITYLYHSLT